MGHVEREAHRLESDMQNVVHAKQGSDEYKEGLAILQKDLDKLRHDPKFAAKVMIQISSDAKEDKCLPRVLVNSDFKTREPQAFLFMGSPLDETSNQMVIPEYLTTQGKQILDDTGPTMAKKFWKSYHKEEKKPEDYQTKG